MTDDGPPIEVGAELESPAGDRWRAVATDDRTVTVTLVGGTGHEVVVSRAEIDYAAAWTRVDAVQLEHKADLADPEVGE